MGTRPTRGRARPPEHQGRLARVREDRGPARLSLLRQRRGRQGCHARGAAPALRRRRLLGRRPDRPAAGHPRRGPARLVGRDRVRRLVQRPPRLPGARVRPLARAGGRDRERQRRARRRAHARADPGGAGAHRHHRRGDRGDQRRRRPRDPRRRPARARSRPPGRRSRSASSASSRVPTSSSIRPTWSSIPRAPPSSKPRHRRSSATSSTCATMRHARPQAKPRRIRLRFLASPVAIHGEGKVEAIELVRNELVDGRAVATEERETIPCGIVFRSVGYRGVALPGVPFDEGSGTIPNEGGRVEPGLYAAGWIKRGPSGVIGTNKKDATETIELLLEDARAGRLPAALRRGARGPARGARRRLGHVRGLAGDRRGRAERRRAARPAADQALELGRAPRRGAPDVAVPSHEGRRHRAAAPTTRAWSRSPSSAFAAASRGRSRRARGVMRKPAAARAASTSAGPTRAT